MDSAEDFLRFLKDRVSDFFIGSIQEPGLMPVLGLLAFASFGMFFIGEAMIRLAE